MGNARDIAIMQALGRMTTIDGMEMSATFEFEGQTWEVQRYTERVYPSRNYTFGIKGLRQEDGEVANLDIQGGDFSNLYFDYVNFTGVDFSDTNFNGTTFYHCAFWTIPNTPGLQRAKFKNCEVLALMNRSWDGLHQLFGVLMRPSKCKPDDVFTRFWSLLYQDNVEWMLSSLPEREGVSELIAPFRLYSDPNNIHEALNRCIGKDRGYILPLPPHLEMTEVVKACLTIFKQHGF